MIVLTLSLTACSTSRETRSFSAALDEVDRAIAIAEDSNGAVALELSEGGQVMMSDPRREENRLCGDVYDRRGEALVTTENGCYPLAEVTSLEVYQDRISIEDTAGNVAQAVVIAPIFLLFALGCLGQDSCHP